MEWQPIETAPKDGRLSLVRKSGGDEWCGTFTAYWSAARGAWFYSQDRSVATPTHWMPLPNPPKE
jgi:hypothetical protein